MKKENVKNFIKDHAGEIILVTCGIGLFAIGAATGSRYVKSKSAVSKLNKLNQGMVDDIAILMKHADSTKNLSMQYTIECDGKDLIVSDLGKLGDYMLKYAGDRGWDVTSESKIVGALVYTKR